MPWLNWKKLATYIFSCLAKVFIKFFLHEYLAKKSIQPSVFCLAHSGLINFFFSIMLLIKLWILFIFYQLLIGYESGLIVLWDLKTKLADIRYQGVEPLRSLYWLSDGKQLISAHGDGSLSTWSSRPGARQGPLLTTYPHGVSAKLAHLLVILNDTFSLSLQPRLVRMVKWMPASQFKKWNGCPHRAAILT